MIERNPIEYRYNSLISSIIQNNKFIEYNDVDNKYYLKEIAYKTIIFEKKYREYVEQLPVMMKGMQAYGYQVSINDIKEPIIKDSLMFRDLKDMVKLAYDNQVQLNTQHVEELMDMITENRLGIYKDVLSGKYDIKKGDEWKDDNANKRLIVKNIEVFEKVVPIFLSLSKQYETDSIREIFEYCRQKNGSFNFAAIKRIRLLVNLIYNNNNGRLDLPIIDYMKSAYEFCDLKTVHKSEIFKFHQTWALKYAQQESTDKIIIERSPLTMETLVDTFKKLFNCLIKQSRPTKEGMIDMERVELIWKERKNNDTQEMNEQLFALAEFLDNNKIDVEYIDDENDKEIEFDNDNPIF